jgi:hypothetical protein
VISFLLLQEIAQLFLILFFGWLLVRCRILKSSDSRILSVIVLYLIFPCSIITSFQLELTADRLRGMLLALIAAAVHFALGLVLRFPPVLFGAVKHLSGLIAFGQFYNAERMAKIPFETLALVGVIMMLVYVAAFVLSAKLGCAKRLLDREETVNGQTASK